MSQALAEVLQYRPRPLDVRVPTAGHDRQGAVLSPRRAAGHRCVHPVHAGAGQQLSRHFAGGGRLQAGEVDQQLTGPGALNNATLAKHHLAHRCGIGQAQQHQLGIATQLGRCLHPPSAVLQQWQAFVGIAVPYRQRITGG